MCGARILRARPGRAALNTPTDSSKCIICAPCKAERQGSWDQRSLPDAALGEFGSASSMPSKGSRGERPVDGERERERGESCSGKGVRPKCPREPKRCPPPLDAGDKGESPASGNGSATLAPAANCLPRGEPGAAPRSADCCGDGGGDGNRRPSGARELKLGDSLHGLPNFGEDMPPIIVAV